MTVVYTHEVATGSKLFGNFWKLLLRWKGSIYKLVLPDLCMYIFFYYIISCVYRFWLAEKDDDDYNKKMFHLLVGYCSEFSSLIPLQFVLGFYVSQIVTRWWSQFMTIPWPDTLSLIVATCVHGHDDRGRMMRRTIMRYVNTTLTMTFTMISTQARSRFPTLDHLTEAGFLVPHERLIIEHLNEKSEGPKYWVPIVWAGAVASRARKEGRIRDDVALFHLIQELTKFRTMCGDLLSYDWVCIPIVYTQVVTLCAYVYFAACLLGKQFLQSKTHDEIDFYIPVFHFLEYFFLMGWLKVAETMVNPFGEDDDDFEVNWLIDRNFTVAYLIVDEMNSEFPEMIKDAYWEEVVPDELPYTHAAMKFKTETFTGSANLSSAPDGNHAADFLSKKGEGSIIGSTMMSLGKKHSYGFRTDEVRKNDPERGNRSYGGGGGEIFNLSMTDRLQKNSKREADLNVSTSLTSRSDEGEKDKGYAHLMDRSYVPRKRDSEDADGTKDSGQDKPQNESPKRSKVEEDSNNPQQNLNDFP